MEVTSQLHALTALSQAKKPNNFEPRGDTMSGRPGKKNILPLLGMEQGFLDCPTHTIDIRMNTLYPVVPEHLSMFFHPFLLTLAVGIPKKIT
jgi:hypothetical protein